MSEELTKVVDGPTYEIVKDGQVVKKNLLDVIDKNDLWNSGGVKVISLVGIQKLANAENIVEKKIVTEVTPTEGNKQQHVVNIWVGFKGDNDPDNWARGSGEASMLNTGEIVTKSDGTKRYEEYNKIDSKYRYAMADKRAFCRAVTKLVRLYGVYSEVEAKEFLAKKPDGSEDYDY